MIGLIEPSCLRGKFAMSLLFTSLRAFIYMCGFIFLWGWIAMGVRAYDRQIGLVMPAWTPLPGIILVIAGGLLTLLCVGTFVGRGKGTAAPFDAPRQFVATGPYRYVRNPMYIGAWFVLIGFGFLECSVSIVVFSIVWILGAHAFVVFVEEPGLGARFGESYTEYKKSVSRWLPRRK